MAEGWARTEMTPRPATKPLLSKGMVFITCLIMFGVFRDVHFLKSHRIYGIGIVITSFYRRGNWGTEISMSPKITELGFEPFNSDSKVLTSFILPHYSTFRTSVYIKVVRNDHLGSQKLHLCNTNVILSLPSNITLHTLIFLI